MKVTVYRKTHFNAAHRLFNPKWNDQQNQEVFGLCSNPLYHGHNYELEVSLTGVVNPETGFLFDLSVLKNLLKIHVEDKLDHKNLNLEVEEFKSLNPTAEHISYVIFHCLRPHIPKDLELGVKLWETPRNYVYYHE